LPSGLATKPAPLASLFLIPGFTLDGEPPRRASPTAGSIPTGDASPHRVELVRRWASPSAPRDVAPPSRDVAPLGCAARGARPRKARRWAVLPLPCRATQPRLGAAGVRCRSDREEREAGERERERQAKWPDHRTGTHGRPCMLGGGQGDGRAG